MKSEKIICIEFGLRRAQGPDGSLSASQYSYLGGFDSTSNLIAGFKFNIPISGTMGHSFISSYKDISEVTEFKINNVPIKKTALQYIKKLGYSTHQGELAAFLQFAKSFPQNLLCIVDTYCSISSGIPNFICVALALKKANFAPIGIRLDSGDLSQISLKAR